MIMQNLVPGEISARVTKSVWTRATITVIELASAKGATAGPNCDKHGSLSRHQLLTRS